MKSLLAVARTDHLVYRTPIYEILKCTETACCDVGTCLHLSLELFASACQHFELLLYVQLAARSVVNWTLMLTGGFSQLPLRVEAGGLSTLQVI
jgi:hypothetical protein